MKKNKKVIICLMSITVFSLIFIGCQKNEDKYDHKYDYILNMPAKFNEVGKLHNEGLDSVYATIKRICIENSKEENLNLKTTRIIDQNTIKEATLKFCKTNKMLKGNYEICEATVVNLQTKLKSNRLKSAFSEGLNQAQQEFLDEIKKVLGLKFSEQNLLILKDSLNQINFRASKTLNETEAISIYCATSTAYSTYQYWQKNYKKWYFAIHFPEILKLYTDAQLNKLVVKDIISTKKSTTDWWIGLWNTVEDWYDETTTAVSNWWDDNGQDIATADAMGAAAAAWYAIDSGLGEITLVFGPEGWVLTVTGAAVGGAIYSSAVMSIWPF